MDSQEKENDFSELSYELQFKYLLELDFRDTMNYCQSNKSALNICQDSHFWQQKALHNFQIPLNVIPRRRPAEQYQNLEDYFRNSPGHLAIFIMKRGLTNRVLDLIKRTEFVHRGKEPFKLDTYLIDYSLDYATDLGDPKIIQAIINKLREELTNEEWTKIQGSIERNLYKALRAYREDLYEIFAPYHQPRYDIILGDFHEALLKGDVTVVRYLRPMIRNEVFELVYTLRSQSPQLLEDFKRAYPRAFQDPEFVTKVAIELIARNQLPNLATLNSLAPNMINRREVERLLARYQDPKFSQEVLSLLK